MSASLVGSEMCIRDRFGPPQRTAVLTPRASMPYVDCRLASGAQGDSTLQPPAQPSAQPFAAEQAAGRPASEGSAQRRARG
eukprot:1803119-Alexandrium_andersonii.AAC.1